MRTDVEKLRNDARLVVRTEGIGVRSFYAYPFLHLKGALQTPNNDSSSVQLIESAAI